MKLQPQGPGSGSAPGFQRLDHTWPGHFLLLVAQQPQVPSGPAPLTAPAPTAPLKANHSLSLPVLPTQGWPLGRGHRAMARGCEGGTEQQRGRWLEMGAEDQMLRAASPGLAVEAPATKRPVPPLGFLGPGTNLARCPLPSSEGKGSPYSLFTPQF